MQSTEMHAPKAGTLVLALMTGLIAVPGAVTAQADPAQGEKVTGAATA